MHRWGGHYNDYVGTYLIVSGRRVLEEWKERWNWLGYERMSDKWGREEVGASSGRHDRRVGKILCGRNEVVVGIGRLIYLWERTLVPSGLDRSGESMGYRGVGGPSRITISQNLVSINERSSEGKSGKLDA
ncbi:hypothetical protein Tco_0073949 [Tanacetum coccineum]